MWGRAAESMEEQLLQRRADHAKEAEAVVSQETRVEEALQAEHEKVAQELQHIRFDKEKISQEHALMEESVAARTSVERAEMEKFEEDRRRVRTEIEEIMQLLKQKEVEEAALSQRLAAAGERVLQVRASFAPKIASLEERTAAAAARENECASRHAAIAAAQDELREERARTKQQHTVIASAIAQSEQRVVATRELAQRWASQVEEMQETAAHRRSLVEEEDAARAAIAKVRGQMNEVLALKEQSAQQMLVVQQQVSRYRSQLASLDAQVCRFY